VAHSSFKGALRFTAPPLLNIKSTLHGPPPPFGQAIDAFKPASRLLNRPLRLPLADVSRAGKQGVTVSGKLEGGALRVGSRVLAMPAGQAATVK
jgi:elongation factor 1 alpha-like protein